MARAIKGLLTICLFMALISTVLVGGWVGTAHSFILMSGTAPTGGGGYSCASDAFTPNWASGVQERFECGAVDGNEELTWTGTGNPDFTTNCPIGNECAEIAAESLVTVLGGGTDSKLYVTLMATAVTIDSNNAGIQVLDSSDNVLGECRLVYSTSRWYIRNYVGGAAGNYRTEVNIVDNDEFYLKMEYDNGAAGSITCNAYEIAHGSFVAWANGYETTADAVSDTAQVNKINIYGFAGTNWKIRDVRVDDAAITY